MAVENKEYWEQYLRTLADQMGLRDWRIELSDEYPEKEDAAAQVNCVYGRKLAHIRLAKEWGTYSKEEQRHYLVHELVHPHIEPMFCMVENDMKGVLGNQAYEVLIWPYRRTMEFTVDGLASVIASFIPLPDVPKS